MSGPNDLYQARQRFVGAPAGDGWRLAGEKVVTIPDVQLNLPVARYTRDGCDVEPGAVVSFTETVERIAEDPGAAARFRAGEASARLIPHVLVNFAITDNPADPAAFLKATKRANRPTPEDPWPQFVKFWCSPVPVSGVELWSALNDALGVGFTGDDLQTAFGSPDHGIGLVRAAAVAVVLDHVEWLPARERGRFYASVAASGILPTFDSTDAGGPLAVEVFADEMRKHFAALEIPALLDAVAALTE